MRPDIHRRGESCIRPALSLPGDHKDRPYKHTIRGRKQLKTAVGRAVDDLSTVSTPALPLPPVP